MKIMEEMNYLLLSRRNNSNVDINQMHAEIANNIIELSKTKSQEIQDEVKRNYVDYYALNNPVDTNVLVNEKENAVDTSMDDVIATLEPAQIDSEEVAPKTR